MNKSKGMVSEYKGLLRKATNNLETDVDAVQQSSKKVIVQDVEEDSINIKTMDDELQKKKEKIDLNYLRKVQVQQQTKLDSIGNIVRDLAT